VGRESMGSVEPRPPPLRASFALVRPAHPPQPQLQRQHHHPHSRRQRLGQVQLLPRCVVASL
jgi:hypothetical protein